VQAEAFGARQPYRDLLLSPDHAVFVDGVLIPVKYLVNDTSVTQVPMEHVLYYHVEVPQHSILLAEVFRWKAIWTSATARTSSMATGPSRCIRTSHRVSGKPLASRRWW